MADYLAWTDRLRSCTTCWIPMPASHAPSVGGLCLQNPRFAHRPVKASNPGSAITSARLRHDQQAPEAGVATATVPIARWLCRACTPHKLSIANDILVIVLSTTPKKVRCHGQACVGHGPAHGQHVPHCMPLLFCHSNDEQTVAIREREREFH